MDNAVKYTAPVDMVKIDATSCQMFTSIDIWDNGIRIEESEIPKI